MNRRGFFGLLGKALAVGAAIGVSPEILNRTKTAANALEVKFVAFWQETGTVEFDGGFTSTYTFSVYAPCGTAGPWKLKDLGHDSSGR